MAALGGAWLESSLGLFARMGSPPGARVAGFGLLGVGLTYLVFGDAIRRWRRAEAMSPRRLSVSRRQKSESSRLLGECAPAILWTTDRSFRVTSTSGAALQAAEAQVVDGRPIPLPEFLGNSSTTPLAERALYGALRGEAQCFEHQFSDRLFQCQVEPLTDDLGAVIGTVGVGIEVTEQRRTQKVLLDEYERLAVTLDGIADAVITTDAEGRVLLMNRVAERVTGRTRLEALHRPLEDIVDLRAEGSGGKIGNPLREIGPRNELEEGEESWLITNDLGQDRRLSQSISPIQTAGGDAAGAVLVLRDVTDQHRRDRERRRAEQFDSLVMLAGGVAHDFNNILTAVLGHIALARLAPGASLEDRDEVLSRAEHAALQARELTNQLLTFSRTGVPTAKAASTRSLIEDSARFAATGARTELSFRFDADLYPVHVDEAEISRVIHNLVINAKQAMGDGGELWVEAENTYVGDESEEDLEPGDYVRLSFRDNGCGIPRERLARVFDPYFTTKAAGNGLGLATCEAIVRRHGGVIDVESDVGVGTTFSILLPASSDQPERAQSNTESIEDSEMGWNVLVIDDEANIREILSAMLARLGHNPVTAADGHEGLEKYEAAFANGDPYDAVIVDLTVSGGTDGKETIDSLRGVDPAVRAIVSSGYPNDPVMEDCRRFGFRERVAKPFHMADLELALARAMS